MAVDGRPCPARPFSTVHDDETDSKRPLSTVVAVDVVLLRWPLEGERRDRLAREGRLRLLLVDGETAPPSVSDCLEDWIRVPASEADMKARADALTTRFGAHRHDLPSLDHDGVLRFGGGWTSLPPVEARLMDTLVTRFGAVVSREHLAKAGWPEGAPGRNALDVHMLRLRRRIGALGLAIKTVRSRGYLLESAVTVPEPLEAGNGSSETRQQPVRNA
jgi:DNA-binding winged helix-turn-helix (wHTH) protein